MANKKGTSKKSTAVKKAPAASVSQSQVSSSDDSGVMDSGDAVMAIDAALKSNAQHCASLAPDVDESDLREVLIARLRYGKINLNDLNL